MGVREYLRTPVLLALLVVLPAYMILHISSVTPDVPIPLAIVDGVNTASLPDAYAVLMTPMAGALVGGIAGLFLMRMTRDADARLVLTGYRPAEVVLARFGLLGGVTAVVTLLSVAILAWQFVPEQPAWFALAVLLASLTYAMLGVLAGTVLDRLAGVYVMLFLPTLDVFLFENPSVSRTKWYAPLLPGHFAVRAVFQAGFTGGVDLAGVGWALGYLAVLVAVATVVFYRSMKH